MTKTKRLQRLHRLSTRYEVTLQTKDGAEYLVGYTMRRSGHGLLGITRRSGEEIIKLVGITDEDTVTFARGRKSMSIGDGVTIAFTGRTERDAICNGEHSRIPA